MKRVIMIATLLMVGCGGQQGGNNAEQTTQVKVSQKRVYGEQPELNVVMPKSAPVDIEVITADKNIDFINKKTTITVKEE